MISRYGEIWRRRTAGRRGSSPASRPTTSWPRCDEHAAPSPRPRYPSMPVSRYAHRRLPRTSPGGSSIQVFHGALAGSPEFLEHVLFLQRVHARPEAEVAVGHQLAVAREPLDRLALPDRCRRRRCSRAPRAFSTKKPPLIQPSLSSAFSWNVGDLVAVEADAAEAGRRPHRGDRRQLAVRLVEVEQLGDVDVGDAVAVGQQERLVVGRASCAAACTRPPVCVSWPVSTRWTRQSGRTPSWIVCRAGARGRW